MADEFNGYNCNNNRNRINIERITLKNLGFYNWFFT